jgi:hypothetical protein
MRLNVARADLARIRVHREQPGNVKHAV